MMELPDKDEEGTRDEERGMKVGGRRAREQGAGGREQSTMSN
jgi:hypothetical protein